MKTLGVVTAIATSWWRAWKRSFDDQHERRGLLLAATAFVVAAALMIFMRTKK